MQKGREDPLPDHEVQSRPLALGTAKSNLNPRLCQWFVSHGRNKKSKEILQLSRKVQSEPLLLSKLLMEFT